MADLTGTMSSIGGVNLNTEAAIKYSEMMTAFGKEMPLLYGYVSEWDWYAEMAPCATVALDQLAEHQRIVALIGKPDPTEDDRKAISTYMSGISNFDISKHPNAEKAWAAFSKFTLSWPSPFFKSTTSEYIYGWPNKQEEDPRRTGKVIVFRDTATTFEWLIENSYKYGFVWYGPTNEVFVYVGSTATFSADFKAAATMGLKAPLYQIYKQAKQKAPTTKQEVVDWVNSLSDTGYQNGNASIEKKKLANSWIAWDVFMNKVE